MVSTRQTKPLSTKGVWCTSWLFPGWMEKCGVAPAPYYQVGNVFYFGVEVELRDRLYCGPLHTAVLRGCCFG